MKHFILQKTKEQEKKGELFMKAQTYRKPQQSMGEKLAGKLKYVKKNWQLYLIFLLPALLLTIIFKYFPMGGVLIAFEDYNVIDGVLGQVDGLIVPDLIGTENGLSAFGDVYAWFKRLVIEPVKPLILSSDAISDECKAALIRDMEDRIMGEFNREAAALEESLDLPFATDFFNGRRAPKPDMRL